MVGDAAGKGTVTLWLRGPWAGLQGEGWQPRGAMHRPHPRCRWPSTVCPGRGRGRGLQQVCPARRCVLPQLLAASPSWGDY